MRSRFSIYLLAAVLIVTMVVLILGMRLQIKQKDLEYQQKYILRNFNYKNEEYQIYSLLLEDILGKIKKQRKQHNSNHNYCFVISNKSRTDLSYSPLEYEVKDWFINLMREESKDIDITDDDILYDYIHMNFLVQGGLLRDKFNFKSRGVTACLINGGIFNGGSFLPEGGWKAFYKRYPDAVGFFELSRVGFNKSSDIGIVYVGHLWGPMSGIGEIIKVQKINNNWVIVKRKNSWLS
jgi:hypothetical protein